VLKEDKGDYINALIAARESDDITLFLDFMAEEMVKTITTDINAYLNSIEESGEKKPKVGRKYFQCSESTPNTPPRNYPRRLLLIKHL
jgi:hypothetical protein